jgi:hypothetical protein
MGAKRYILYIGEYMITNAEKIDTINNRLNNLEFIINSFIAHAEEFKNKYSLDQELANCNRKKTALLEEKQTLTNQG